MDRTIGVRTPESIAFSYDLAGLGSRFLAVTLDFLIQLLVFAALLTGLIFAASGAPKVTSKDTTLPESTVIAIVVAVIFLLFFAYFVLFEAFWNGQTPGKKLLGIRVVRDGGYPLDFGASAIRNLIRIGELTVGMYLLSAISALVSAENKRLGDFAAGTIVVRDARAPSLAHFTEEATGAPFSPLLSDAEQSLIDKFLARRDELEHGARMRIAGEISDRIRPRLSRDLQRLDDEELLERLRS